MADETYDAVVIGGGAKGLITAMYLAKYGGMDVAIFERRHEAGGGWCTDEMAAPGFLADYHCNAVRPHYHLPTERDFPEWTGEYRQMTKHIDGHLGIGAIFKEDHSSIIAYGLKDDPTQERTAKSISKFSPRDGETWMEKVLDLIGVFTPIFAEWALNPPVPPGELDVLDRLMLDPKFDPSWAGKSLIGVLRDLFESEALIAMLVRAALSGGRPAGMPGLGVLQLMWTLGIALQLQNVRGGTHNYAHAAVKIFLANRGKMFTRHPVEKVTIENGTATGVRLTDGTEIKARKLVLSTLDPYSLCFRLIGKDYFNGQILRRVEHLERRIACIAWYTWALKESPDYAAAGSNPDLNDVDAICLISKDPEATLRETNLRMAGIMPSQLQLACFGAGATDKTRVPEGKTSLMTEQFVLPANCLSEEQWLEFKKSHAEAVIKHWQEFAPNMSWDNVIGYASITPYDVARSLPNMGPEGNWAVIDNIPGQIGKFRPIPELARHKTPIKNLYATGSAWHPVGCGAAWQGYNCYKIIADDLGLGKPWEGLPW